MGFERTTSHIFFSNVTITVFVEKKATKMVNNLRRKKANAKDVASWDADAKWRKKEEKMRWTPNDGIVKHKSHLWSKHPRLKCCALWAWPSYILLNEVLLNWTWTETFEVGRIEKEEEWGYKKEKINFGIAMNYLPFLIDNSNVIQKYIIHMFVAKCNQSFFCFFFFIFRFFFCFTFSIFFLICGFLLLLLFAIFLLSFTFPVFFLFFILAN